MLERKEYARKHSSLPPLLLAMPAGYDGRHHSLDFAKIAAAVFAGQGIRVHLFSALVPTPFVPTAVQLLVSLSRTSCGMLSFGAL